jgi:ppGpp synthetase/RelA/SpoT-type nucleotidyltranferase
MTTDPLALPPRNEIEALGNRLRDAAEPSDGDLRLLEELLLVYDEVLREVADQLRSIGLEPTTRLKTSGTIHDKLRRQSRLKLWAIRDLAGARVVRRMTLDEQDAVAAEIQALWPGAGLIDRRELPSHGYRAVHVVPRVRECPVEIQIRTMYQDGWAQFMESIGDQWGRAIRYGGEPRDPDSPAWEGEPLVTRRQVVTTWIEMADTIRWLTRSTTLL